MEICEEDYNFVAVSTIKIIREYGTVYQEGNAGLAREGKQAGVLQTEVERDGDTGGSGPGLCAGHDVCGGRGGRIRGRFFDPKATLRAEDRRRTPRELKWME